MTNGNDLAHPALEYALHHEPIQVVSQHFGLTKREEFAKAALIAVLSASITNVGYPKRSAEEAVACADALIEALNKPEVPHA